jgi:putative heme transporter
VTASASADGCGSTGRQLLRSPAAHVVLPVLVVVAIFAGVLPRITDYALAWTLVTGLHGSQLAFLAALATVNLGSYAPVWMAAVPGLGWWRATLADQASTAVANTIPAGFAFGVGTTATMYHSFGVSAGATTRAVALTGIWNTMVKLGMPVVALAGLALTGEATRTLLLPAALGVVVLLLALSCLALVLTHRKAAAAVAGLGERLAVRLAQLGHRSGPSGWVGGIERFRTESLTLVHRRWPHLTAAAVGSHVALFVLLLACIRLVDGAESDVGWLRVLAVFSFTRLITMIPVTPGALGVAELSYVAGLSAVGMNPSAAGAAVLVFRFLTWFLPIPCGALAWLLWRRTAARAGAPGLRSTVTGG